MAPPSLTLHPLHRANGSAHYTCPTTGTTLLAAVNAPLESSRRDKELPEAAAIEIHVRPPSNGSGGPRERWLESVLAPMWRRVVLVDMFPRAVVQISVQVLSIGEGGKGWNARTADVLILPSLVNGIFAALLDAAVPMAMGVVAGLGVLGEDGRVGIATTERGNFLKEIGTGRARSVHAMVFTARGDLIMEESVGAFGLEDWGVVVEALRPVCLAALGARARAGRSQDGEEEEMRDEGDENGEAWLRDAVEREVEVAGRWRESG